MTSERARRIVDRETYRGYAIVLPSLDWDADYQIYDKDGLLVASVPNRSDAKEWVDREVQRG